MELLTMEEKKKSKTSLTIDKDLLREVKNIAFDLEINQSEVIERCVKYCVENEIEAIKVE